MNATVCLEKPAEFNQNDDDDDDVQISRFFSLDFQLDKTAG